MFNEAHSLSPTMMTALATNFAALNPTPLGDAPKELAAAGKKIYEEGIPDSNISPCASCHDPQARGNGEFPRLAGQLYDYVVKNLTNWSKERGQRPEKPDTLAIMEPIAHVLTEPQIKAVAAYVSWTDFLLLVLIMNLKVNNDSPSRKPLSGRAPQYRLSAPWLKWELPKRMFRR